MSHRVLLHRQRAAQAPAAEALVASGLARMRFNRQNPQLYRIATMTKRRPGSDVETAVANSAFARLARRGAGVDRPRRLMDWLASRRGRP